MLFLVIRNIRVVVSSLLSLPGSVLSWDIVVRVLHDEAVSVDTRVLFSFPRDEFGAEERLKIVHYVCFCVCGEIIQIRQYEHSTHRVFTYIS